MRSRTLHAVLILAAVLVTALWFRVPGIERALFRDWSDDSFFYVIIADSLVEGRGPTSDGVGLTNGYHPLWMLVHVALRAAFQDPLRALAVVQFLVLAAALLLLYRFLSGYVGATLAALVAVTASLETTYRQVLGAGMETGPAFVALLLTLLALRGPPPWERSWRRLLPLQAALALLFFARLDGGLCWVALAATALLPAVRSGRELGRRALGLLRLFLPPAVPAAAYLAWNHSVFGTAMPISGRIKALSWAEVAAAGPLAYLGGAFDRLAVLYGLQGLPLPGGLSAYFPRRAPLDAAFWSLYLLAAALAVGITLRGLWRQGRLDLPVVTLATATALHTFYYAFMQHDRYALSWARGPELLLLTVSLAWLASRLAVPVVPAPARQVTAGVALIPLLALLWTGSRDRALHPGNIRDFNTSVSAFREGVAFIREHTAEDEIIASESIGFLGHYADRRIVSLDGLLNSLDYRRRYLARGRVGDYLREHRVRYVAQGLRKDVEPIAYLSGVLGLAPDEVEVAALFDGPVSTPRRYVVFRLRFAAEGSG